MWQMKDVAPRAHKFAMRSLLLAGTTLFALVALVPAANAQVVISVTTPPICSYGYYDYAPYACAPVGFYGPGYFFNGIFLGVGPWGNWGYNHGWGAHRFNGGGGGRYVAGRRDGGGRGPSAVHANRGGGLRGNASVRASHSTAARGGAAHGGGSSHGSSHAAAAGGGGSHGGGSGSHGGGSHGGGEHR